MTVDQQYVLRKEMSFLCRESNLAKKRIAKLGNQAQNNGTATSEKYGHKGVLIINTFNFNIKTDSSLKCF
jgi:hypothetical protein